MTRLISALRSRAVCDSFKKQTAQFWWPIDIEITNFPASFSKKFTSAMFSSYTNKDIYTVHLEWTNIVRFHIYSSLFELLTHYWCTDCCAKSLTKCQTENFIKRAGVCVQNRLGHLPDIW